MAVNRELKFLQELIFTQDMTTVVDNGITHKFLTGKYRKAFRFIQRHQKEYGKLPTYETFLNKTDIELPLDADGNVEPTGEKLKYWCNELREKRKHNTLVDTSEEIIEKLNEGDAEGAYSILKKTLLVVENEVVLSDRAKINEGTSKRKEAYLKAQKCGGMTGIPSGIEHWDNLIGGYNNGELITAMAYTGVGKTWWEIVQSVFLAQNGYRVLFFTTEMASVAIMKRIDAVWCKLNYSRFKKGQLLPDEEKRYFDYLDEMESTPDDEVMLVVEQATGGVTQISAKIDQYDPDIVFVDGAYLLENDEGDEENWLSMVKIWRGLHKVALAKDKPIVVTTQSKDETNATLKSAQFAKAIAQDCDVFVVLEQDAQMKYDREMKMRPLKLREGSLLSSVMLNWDFDEMDYSSLYSHEESPDEEVKSSSDNVIDLG